MDELAGKIVGVFTTDHDLNIQIWDPALERMTGLAAEAVTGRPLVEVIPDLASRGLLERFERSLRHGTAEILAPALHNRLIACPPAVPSGHFSEMQQQVTIMALTDGPRVTGLTVTVEDVTARMERKMDGFAKLNDPDRSVRLEIAREISDETAPIPPELMGPIIEGLGDSDWRVRRRLTQALARRAAPEAIYALLIALKEKHLEFGTVNSVLQVLKSTDVDTTGALIDFLSSDDADLRIQAALALGEHPGAPVASALVGALADPDPNVRYQAIESLGRIRATESVGALLKIAEERDFFLSFAALESIGQIGESSIESRLKPFLEDDLFWEPAARSLAKMGSTDAGPTLARLLNEPGLPVSPVAEILMQFLDRHKGEPGTDRSLRERVAGEISENGIERFVEALDRAGESDIANLIALAGWIPGKRVAQELTALMEDSDLSESAAASLAAQGTVAVDFLVPQLESSHEHVRVAAAELLGLARSEVAVGPLIAQLDRGAVPTDLLARSLGMIGGNEAAEALVRLLGSDSTILQKAGIEGFSQMGGRTGVAELVKLVDSEHADVRRCAVEACGRSGIKESCEAIIRRCSDEDDGVRASAVRALRSVAGERGAERVIPSLQDHSPAVRAAAAVALSEYSSGEASEALAGALGDPDPWTRYYALRGLGRLKASSWSELIRRVAMEDPAEHVRMAAGEVLNELGV
jgi:HEAT repeat protein